MIEFRAMVLLMFAALIATTVGVLTYLSGQPPAAGSSLVLPQALLRLSGWTRSPPEHRADARNRQLVRPPRIGRISGHPSFLSNFGRRPNTGSWRDAIAWVAGLDFTVEACDWPTGAECWLPVVSEFVWLRDQAGGVRW